MFGTNQRLTFWYVIYVSDNSDERVVAIGLLTQRDLDLLGPAFARPWPIDETPCFNGLLVAIAEADRAIRRGRSKDQPQCDESRRRVDIAGVASSILETPTLSPLIIDCFGGAPS